MSPAHPDDNFNFDGTASLVPVRTTVVECEFVAATEALLVRPIKGFVASSKVP